MSVSVSMSGSGVVGLGIGLPAGGIRASQGTFFFVLSRFILFVIVKEKL